MAFNEQEQEIIRFGVENGKSKEDVQQAITNFRLGIVEPKKKEQPTATLGSRLASGYKQGFEDIKQAVGTGANALQNQGGDQLSVKNVLGKVGSLLETGLNTAGAVAKTAFSPISAIAEPVVQPIVSKLVEIPGIKGTVEQVSEWAKAHPQAATDLQSLVDIGTLGVGSSASKVAKDVAIKTGDALATGVSDISKGIQPIKQSVSGALEGTSEAIMNKVARVTPKEAQSFKSMTGKSIGEYLTEKGNFNSPTKIIENEAKTFTQTLADKEATLAKLPGTYQSGVVDDVLQSLKQKALETSSENVKAPYLKQVEDWIQKSQTTGLTMEEINNAKKLFEREVKLGYNKLVDSTKIKQATYLDTALREFQDNIATKLGFTNIGELSKQIQASKFIIDKLGNKIIGNNLLNGVSLTDYILLSGGEPTSVAGFLTKKIFSSKNIQAKIAELLNKKEIKSPVKANYSPQATKATQIKNKTKNPISPKSTTSSLKVKGEIPKQLEPLAQEAQKYKSAEEFVKAQRKNRVWHGTNADFEKFDPNMGYKGDVGTWFTPSSAIASEGTTRVIQRFVKPNLKFATETIENKIGSPSELMAKGYRGVKYRDGNIKLYYPNEDTFTKSQLTDFYNKVKKK